MEKAKQERLAYLRTQFRIRPYGNNLSDPERKELSTLSLLEKEEDRQHFGPDTFDWMVELLYRHDPIRLAACECPKDEYDNEARTILKALEEFNGTPNLGQILQIVYDTFAEAFNAHENDNTAGKIGDIPYLLASQEIFVNLHRIKK